MLRTLFLFVVFSTSNALASESGGMPQLDPHSWVPQIFWLILTFTFLYLIISKIVFPRLSESIEQRDDYVSDLLDEAKKLSEKTEKLNQDYNQFIINAKKDAQDLIASNRKKLNSEYEQKKTELDEKLNNLISKAEKEIKDFKNSSISQIQTIATDLSNEIIKELSVSQNEIDSSVLTKRIEEISKKRIGDLN